MLLHAFCTSLDNSEFNPLLIRAGEKFEELAAAQEREQYHSVGDGHQDCHVFVCLLYIFLCFQTFLHHFFFLYFFSFQCELILPRADSSLLP